jgi:hypothetical protein
MDNLDLGTSVVALDPLVVRFGRQVLSLLAPGPMPPIPPSIVTRLGYTPTPSPPAKAAYAIVSDAWDFERLYSTISMTAAHPSWSPATVAKIRKRKVEKGMTKDMIAWMFGYPSAYGSREQVRALDVWNYEAPTPFGYTVHFKNGVVVKYDPPGNLP